ncbi:MAG: FHA domain-containing protein, partial [Anaerolineales bacterium]
VPPREQARRPAARPVPRQAPPPERPAQAPAQNPPPAQRPAPQPPASVVAPAAGMPKACLTALAPANLQVSIQITRPSFTLGRREGNDLVLAVDNKVGVSGHHATIKFVNGAFTLVDDKSTFGTFINEQRLAPGAPTALVEGAIIGLGPKVKLKFSTRDCQ